MGSGRGRLAGDWPSTGAFSTLLRRPGLRDSSDGVLATKSKRKMLASTCLYSLYAWLAYVGHIEIAHDVIHKTGNTQRIPLSLEEDRARPHLTHTENFVKFGRVVFEMCERTDRHTDTLIAILRTLTRRRSNDVS